MHELNHSYEMQTTFEPMALYKKDWNENRVTKFIKNFNIKNMSPFFFKCLMLNLYDNSYHLFFSVIGVKPLLQHIVLPSQEC